MIARALMVASSQNSNVFIYLGFLRETVCRRNQRLAAIREETR